MHKLLALWCFLNTESLIIVGGLGYSINYLFILYALPNHDKCLLMSFFYKFLMS